MGPRTRDSFFFTFSVGLLVRGRPLQPAISAQLSLLDTAQRELTERTYRRKISPIKHMFDWENIDLPFRFHSLRRFALARAVPVSISIRVLSSLPGC